MHACSSGAQRFRTSRTSGKEIGRKILARLAVSFRHANLTNWTTMYGGRRSSSHFFSYCASRSRVCDFFSIVSVSAPSTALYRCAVLSVMWHESLRTDSRAVYGSSSPSRHLYLQRSSIPKSSSPRFDLSISMCGSVGWLGGRSERSPPLASLRFCASSVTSVLQHSSASCCMKPRPPSACCANMGNALRKAPTNLNGRTSSTALLRSSSVTSSRIAKRTPELPPALEPAKFWSAVATSGIIRRHWIEELR
mmetsp:Transcript_50756/g.110154  ORF Transcript_50756/g.110154 Transcript_50756/m.110154 type:complete len:251 (-) Transcript_50756:373-1125(-)